MEKNTDLDNCKKGQSTNIGLEQQFHPDVNMIVEKLYCKLCSIQFDQETVYNMHQSVVHEKAQVIEEELIDSNEVISLHKHSMEDQNPSFPEGNNPILSCDNCHDTFTCTIHEGISIVDEEYHDSQDSDVNDQLKNLGQGKYCNDQNVDEQTADKELNVIQSSAVKGQFKNFGQGPDCSDQNVDSTNKNIEEQFDPDKSIILKDLFP